MTTALPLRRLGRSPVFVTELSFGGAAIGNMFRQVRDDDARAAIDAAWDGGIRTFDTAPPGLSQADRAAVPGGTAARVYRLGESGTAADTGAGAGPWR